MNNLDFTHVAQSNRLIESDLSSTRSNRLIEQTLSNNSDIIDDKWISRHAKLCYEIGVPAYQQLVDRARKYSQTPTTLLAFLVNKELGRI